jgi:hypothetical protein
MSTEEFRASNKRAIDRAAAVDRHFERLYKRLDDINARVTKLERLVWVTSGAVTATGGLAVINLITNLSGR